jgi:phosphoribosylformimino-5-aminoimidazole carboxamide ribotide isomerase
MKKNKVMKMVLSKDDMLIIPAVDIKNSKCVQLVQGKPGTEQVIIENPEKVAKDWEDRGAHVLHIINLDGAFGDSERNAAVIDKVLHEVSVPVQLGGGIRTIEDAAKLLNIGVERVILGTMAVENPENVSMLADDFGSERVMVALDSKDSQVVVKGWTEKTDRTAPQFGKLFEEKGAGGILFTNVDVEGLLQGFDTQPLIELLEAVEIPVVYSGGVTSIEDVAKLSRTDAAGVVIGSALYRGKMKFEDALKYQRIS